MAICFLIFATCLWQMQIEDSISRLSGDDVIELIRENRNDLIKKLMETSYLRKFLSNNFSMEDVSLVKIEFIKRSIKELALMPVDLSHYSTLILEIRRAGSMSISKSNGQYFVQDIQRAIKSYLL